MDEYTEYLKQIVELEGGWSPSDGATFGVYDRYGQDACIWSFHWQFPSNEYPMVRTISPDDMLPVESMSEVEIKAELQCLITRLKQKNWAVEAFALNRILFNALAGLDWLPDMRALLKRCRSSYPCHSSKQASFVFGSIRAEQHPFYKV